MLSGMDIGVSPNGYNTEMVPATCCHGNPRTKVCHYSGSSAR